MQRVARGSLTGLTPVKAPRDEKVARRRSFRLVAPIALSLALVALIAIFSATRDGDEPPPQRAETTPSPVATPTPKPEKPREPAPARAIRGFYEAAANDDWDRAWALAGPDFRRRFGSQDAMAAQLDSLQKIRFRSLRILERGPDRATVSVETVATHTDRVDRCSGTLLAVRVEGTWRADPLALDC